MEPRPLLMEYLDLYAPEQARRHAVPPGIAGWAQVNGRNAISGEEKFALDVWYVDNQSFWLDIRIMVETLHKVVRRDGISGEGTETMTRFDEQLGGMTFGLLAQEATPKWGWIPPVPPVFSG